MRRRLSGIIAVATGALCVAGAYWWFLTPGPPALADMLPAETALYVEARNCEAVVDTASKIAARLWRTGDRTHEGFGDAGTYGRISEVVGAMVTKPMRMPGTKTCAAVDLSEFTYLPSFVVIVRAESGGLLEKQVQRSLDELSGKYPTQTTKSRGWRLSVVTVEEETYVYVGRRRGSLVVTNSADLYGDVITTAAGNRNSLGSDGEFRAARERIGKEEDLFVFVRPQDLGSNFPIDKAVSMVQGQDISGILGEVSAALRGGRVAAAGVTLDEEIVIESFSVGSEEPEVTEKVREVPAGDFKIVKYLYPEVFLAYSWRVDFPSFWEAVDRLDAGAYREYGKYLKILEEVFGDDFKGKVLSCLGCEAAVVLAGSKPPSVLLFVEVKDRGGLEEALNKLVQSDIGPAYAFVGDFLVFSSQPRLLKEVAGAYQSEGRDMLKYEPYVRVMTGLPSTGNSRLYVDVHSSAEIIDEVVSQGIDARGGIDASQKRRIMGLVKSVLDTLRIAQSYGSVTTIAGDEKRKTARLVIALPLTKQL